jgi:hypothetical protein
MKRCENRNAAPVVIRECEPGEFPLRVRLPLPLPLLSLQVYKTWSGNSE